MECLFVSIWSKLYFQFLSKINHSIFLSTLLTIMTIIYKYDLNSVWLTHFSQLVRINCIYRCMTIFFLRILFLLHLMYILFLAFKTHPLRTALFSIYELKEMSTFPPSFFSHSHTCRHTRDFSSRYCSILAPSIAPLLLKWISMYFPNRLELSLRMVLAFPKAVEKKKSLHPAGLCSIFKCANKDGSIGFPHPQGWGWPLTPAVQSRSAAH